jgi:hypothetical protein
MQTFVQLGSKKWVISLIFASAFISSLDRGKKDGIYQLFKDKNILKSNIKDCENGLPCVVKLKVAKTRFADRARSIMQRKL